LVIHNPNIRILLLSHSLSQTASSLREIATKLEQLGLKPVGAKLSKWTQTEIILDRTILARDPTITAASLESNITGRHVDLIIMDDAVTLENSASEEQRSQLREFYSSVMEPILNPDGRIIVTGVRWRPQDFHGEIEEKHSEYKVFKYPAIRANKEALWPSRWPLEVLEEKRKSDTEGGIFFQAQYMLDPGGMLGQRFKE